MMAVVTRTTFADRLWWSRHFGPNAFIGATYLAREVGCTQGLISGLELKNAEGSSFSASFAKALGVDRTWLESGEGEAPAGYNAKAAKERDTGGRLFRSKRWQSRDNVTDMPRRQPAWQTEIRPDPNDNSLAGRAARIIAEFLEFTAEHGEEQADGILKAMNTVKAMVLVEKTKGKK